MINDGYTFEKFGRHVRPLSSGMVLRISDLITKEQWTEVGRELWREPWFIGNSDLSEIEQEELSEIMVGFDLVKSQQNLHNGVTMLLTRPLLAARDCDTCKEYLFDSDTDRPHTREGLLVKREPHFVLACETKEGCPKGHHTNPLELTEINRQAWKHFRDWRVTGLTDNQRICPVLRSNWEIMDTLVQNHGIPKATRTTHNTSNQSSPQAHDGG